MVAFEPHTHCPCSSHRSHPVPKKVLDNRDCCLEKHTGVACTTSSGNEAGIVVAGMGHSCMGSTWVQCHIVPLACSAGLVVIVQTAVVAGLAGMAATVLVRRQHLDRIYWSHVVRMNHCSFQ